MWRCVETSAPMTVKCTTVFVPLPAEDVFMWYDNEKAAHPELTVNRVTRLLHHIIGKLRSLWP
jgi:hypothetical protein